MILVNYTRLDSPLPDSVLRQVLHQLPVNKASAILKLANEKARTSSILGLLLLENAARQLNRENFSISQIVFPPNQKPFHPDNIEFNITHSASIAACAVNHGPPLGIDSESRLACKPVLSRHVFRDEELDQMQSERGEFLEFWVKKEAVAKAAGCGIAGMKHIRLDGRLAYYQDQRWYLHRLTLAEEDLSYLACKAIHPPMEIRYCTLSDLLTTHMVQPEFSQNQYCG